MLADVRYGSLSDMAAIIGTSGLPPKADIGAGLRCPRSAKSSRQQSREGVYGKWHAKANSGRFTGPWTESSYYKYCSIGASPTVT